jgi:hypothetical protein
VNVEATNLAVKQREPSQVAKALQERLLKILSKPINVGSLVELQKTAILARRLLELEQPKEKLLKRLNVGGFSGLNPGYIAGMNFDPELDNQDFDGNSSGAMSEVMSPSPGSETFGAAVIRELIPALKAQAAGQGRGRIHLSDLMEAVTMARNNGNTALVAKIEAKIDKMLSEELEDDEFAAVPPQAHYVKIPKLCDHEGCENLAAVSGSGIPLTICMAHYDAMAVGPEGANV